MAAQGLSKGGVAEWWGIDGEYRAIPTFTCCHCNTIHEVPGPESPDVGFCAKCFARECVGCAAELNGRCAAFERQIEAYEKKQRLLAAVAGG